MPTDRRIRGIALCATLLAAGCGAVGHQVKTGASRIEMEPLKIAVVRDGNGQPRVEAFDAATLFEQAGAELSQQHFAVAQAGYDRVIKEFPDSRYVVPALYNAGLALEGLKDFAGAIDRYRALIDRHGETRDALDALFRMGGCQAEINNWAASAESFARVLEHPDLSTGDRIEAMARRGLAQYQMKDAVASERTFRDALAWYRAHESIERLESDFFLAMCQFYLGEITHDRFRAVALHLPENKMKDELEEKARLLLTAQGQYVDTARVKNPGWATAAGYQMATLYQEFYQSLMAAPVPPQLVGEAREIYFAELRKTIAPLLRKAIHAHELTQQVAERNGIDNEWVRKSSAQLEQLRGLLVPSDGEDQRLPAITPPTPLPPRDEKTEPPPSPPRLDDYHPRVIL